MSKKIKVMMVTIPILVIGLVMTFMCVEKVSAGYVGVVYSMNGGVEDTVLTQGWHLVAPTKKVTTYSIATEQLYMSADEREGSEDNDSFDVVCKDGKMNIDLEMSYSFNPDDVVGVFTKYRGMSGETVVNTLVRGKIKTKVSEVTSQYTVLEAYMEKKSALNISITKELQDYLADFGITVESANITRASVDPSIEKAITDRSRVAQELEVEKQKQEKSRLEAETKIIQAEGDAKKLDIQTQAEAKRYNDLSVAITPELIKKWEMDARIAHGWVTVNGGTAIVDNRGE